MKKINKGFTLIEILVVIGIIAILAAIVIVAINPARQFAQARNTQRESDVSTILNAIGQKSVDCKGVFDATATECPVSPACPTITTLKNIGTDGSLYNLTCLVPTYIASAMPVDPEGGTLVNTGYSVQESTVSPGRYTVCAPNHAETAITGSVEYCLTR